MYVTVGKISYREPGDLCRVTKGDLALECSLSDQIFFLDHENPKNSGY
jgi:hypothetical protein